jgi:hypothetical protein
MPKILGGHKFHRKMNIINRNENYIFYEVLSTSAWFFVFERHD